MDQADAILELAGIDGCDDLAERRTLAAPLVVQVHKRWPFRDFSIG